MTAPPQNFNDAVYVMTPSLGTPAYCLKINVKLKKYVTINNINIFNPLFLY